ncbi:subclass B1 metallo-beta-lactamase [Pareuzebyella sediminis]|uniref:subclass B1 metallo-beta-lactamase n=1 Tax=Pareuzebyella sediminis TaxID=2607998 RepID=UPI0011EFCB6B|nr:subclass B1 metallo-beta-lactamase [Pareuzebyella sediminis]
MIKKVAILFIILFPLLGQSQEREWAYSSETLKIIAISDYSFIHISYLNTVDFGKVACNGLIYMNNGEAIVFDTPIDIETSNELIGWITQCKNHEVSAVVVNHFHDDCVGGLEAFHEKNIPSYANQRTLELARKEGNPVPEQGFAMQNELMVGGTCVINQFIGEGHTMDNIVSYIPNESLLFGGCLVKSLGASKGNLSDANEFEWSRTVQKIKQKYPDLKTVVPGHGNYGGIELLDYTEELFKRSHTRKSKKIENQSQ